MTPPQLEKADAKETLLISPAWKPVMNSEQNICQFVLSWKGLKAKRHVLGPICWPVYSVGESLSPGESLVHSVCEQTKLASVTGSPVVTAYGTGERFPSFMQMFMKNSSRSYHTHIQYCKSLCLSMDEMLKNILPWHVAQVTRETAGCKAFLHTDRQKQPASGQFLS